MKQNLCVKDVRLTEKQTSLDRVNRFPDFLVVRSNRFNYDRQRARLVKLDTNISMDEYIELTPYRLFPGNNQRYKLVGVTHHLGNSPNTGHYISDCLNKHDNQWYRYMT